MIDTNKQKLIAQLLQIRLDKCASCTCLTKTPKPEYHHESCRYKQLCIKEKEIEAELIREG